MTTTQTTQETTAIVRAVREIMSVFGAQTRLVDYAGREWAASDLARELAMLDWDPEVVWYRESGSAALVIRPRRRYISMPDGSIREGSEEPLYRVI